MNIRKRLQNFWANRPRSRDYETHQEWTEACDRQAEEIIEFFQEFDELEFDRNDPAHCTVKNWQAVWKAATDDGLRPAIETFALTPADAAKHIKTQCWFVCWEAGPYQWGCYARNEIRSVETGKRYKLYHPQGTYFETHWGFDIMMFSDTGDPVRH